jgi:hypothetical protein
MRIDSYTRFLLTIIAICLVYLCAKDFVSAPRVHADEPVRVILVDGENSPLVKRSLNFMGGTAIPVRVETR